EVTLDECLDMAAAKTGALMKCAVAIGAIAVGAPEPDVRALAEFGDNVGLAFQLVDDLLGIWGAPEVTGKPALADLRSKKKSVPVVAALTSGTAAGRELAKIYRQAKPLTDEELPYVAKLVEQAGGLLWTEQEADRRIQLARKNLDSLDLSKEIVQPLWSTALFVTGRDR
ncbi:MAG: polyprenyl synthetase family protein, partial [Sciscionella sp.]|nr:polyprenyl synthetase family protein [Sciscionella sp.]